MRLRGQDGVRAPTRLGDPRAFLDAAPGALRAGGGDGGDRRHWRLAATGNAIGVARAELACHRPAVCLGSLRFGGARGRGGCCERGKGGAARGGAAGEHTGLCRGERALVRCGWAWCAGAARGCDACCDVDRRKEEKPLLVLDPALAWDVRFIYLFIIHALVE